jgi:hypothetical protein
VQRARQAEAEREKRGKIIAAQGEAPRRRRADPIQELGAFLTRESSAVAALPATAPAVAAAVLSNGARAAS